MNTRLFCTRTVARRLGLAVGASALALCASLAGPPARADLSMAPVAVQERPGSVTHGHVFLTGAEAPLDITSQIVTSATQSYYVNGAGSWPISIDYARGLVFDTASSVIGYVDLS